MWVPLAPVLDVIPFEGTPLSRVADSPSRNPDRSRGYRPVQYVMETILLHWYV